MLSLLKIKNIALIDEIEIEFGDGLNLLTGETGSGKSIIVDSLGALTGERVSSDLVKEGEVSAQIEGLFVIELTDASRAVFDESGLNIGDSNESEIIVRREVSLAGRNRIFVNNQLVTSSFLRRIGGILVDIHGQGEHAALFETATHRDMLDEYAGLRDLRNQVADDFRELAAARAELDELIQSESDKLQLLDILRFQVTEIERANLRIGEDAELEDEKRRLNNIEKLSSLSEDAYRFLYENDDSTVTTLDKAAKRIGELAEFDSRFAGYVEGLETARAVIEDAAITARDFRTHLEFSPERLAEIEDRLAEISRVTRKYGGTIETALRHLAESQEKLSKIETAELREEELRKRIEILRSAYIETALKLHNKRIAAAKKFEKETVQNLRAVALDKALFEVRIDAPEEAELKSGDADRMFTARGFDRVEFYFSANVGESPKPLAKVASGGEASRLMLTLKTTAKARERGKTAVFDEIDAGIGGRVAEAVGLKLAELSRSQQVLCVTHQPQVASKADRHFVVEKAMTKNRTTIGIRELDTAARVEELARMLAGEKITETAREHAREMLNASRGRGDTAAG